MSWVIKQQADLRNGMLLEFNLLEGNISCSAPGQKAFLDSYLSCVLFQLPFALETIGFGYLCFPLILTIILISIFGKIKENYRWFILNQACWDFFVIYNFLCSKPSFKAWFDRYQDSPAYRDWLRSVNEGKDL